MKVIQEWASPLKMLNSYDVLLIHLSFILDYIWKFFYMTILIIYKLTLFLIILFFSLILFPNSCQAAGKSNTAVDDQLNKSFFAKGEGK